LWSYSYTFGDFRLFYGWTCYIFLTSPDLFSFILNSFINNPNSCIIVFLSFYEHMRHRPVPNLITITKYLHIMLCCLSFCGDFSVLSWGMTSSYPLRIQHLLTNQNNWKVCSSLLYRTGTVIPRRLTLQTCSISSSCIGSNYKVFFFIREVIYTHS
jgi:hypothetical protein